MEKLTADMLVSLSGIVVSLLAFYFPPFKKLMSTLGEYKFTFLAGILLFTSVVYSYVWCNFNIECFSNNLLSTIFVWFSSLGLNQGTYQIHVKKEKEKQV